MAVKKIEPQLRPISEYTQLDKNDIFRIPEYQRAYSWGLVECDKLWQDINSFIDTGAEDPYFFGTIIIDCSQNGVFNLIDGQQRTTTFLLLLKAMQLRIKDALAIMRPNKDTEPLKDRLGEIYQDTLKILYKTKGNDLYYLKNGDWTKAKGVKVLESASFNELYKSDFQTIMDAETYEVAERGVHKEPRKQKDNKYTNFFRNFKFFYEKLCELPESQLLDFAEGFLQCQVIEIRSWQVEQAIAMFNSLNSTGMPLADADIISAQLFSKAGETERENFKHQWEEIQETAKELNQRNIIDLDDVLRQFMYMERARRKDYKANEVNTPGIRKYYTYLHPELLNEPKQRCEEFRKILAIWDSIEDYPVIRLLLKFNDNFKLFLIPYLFRHQPEELTEEKIRPMAEALLRLFALMETGGKAFSSALFKSFLFNENLLTVDPDYAEVSIIDDFNRHIDEKWEKEEIKKDLLEYNGNLLVFLNEYLFAKEKGLPFQFSETVNVEHIMPASGHNIETIRKDAGIEDAKAFDAIVNQLGNKILLEENINKSISNDWFKTKKGSTVGSRQGYLKSSFGLASKLATYPKDTWEKEDIETATQKAAKRIADFIFSVVEKEEEPAC